MGVWVSVSDLVQGDGGQTGHEAVPTFSQDPQDDLQLLWGAVKNIQQIFVYFCTNRVKLFKTVARVWWWSNLYSSPDFQLRRLGWDSYNQQRKLPRGRHQVRIRMRSQKHLFAGRCWRSGWGPRTTGRSSSTASTWRTRRARMPCFLWWFTLIVSLPEVWLEIIYWNWKMNFFMQEFFAWAENKNMNYLGNMGVND